MSDLATIGPAALPRLERAELVGNRRTFREIAEALGCTERSIYTLVDKHHIPYVRLLNKRFADPADIRNAILRDQSNTPARSRGRPRRAAS